MSGIFKPATRRKAKVKIALVGPSGSGKTYTALRMARGLAGADGKVAVLDTEHGAASLYADDFTFDVVEMGGDRGYHPDRYVGVINEAAQAGYTVLVIDSLSHAWMGRGGILEIVDKASGQNRFGNWKEATPIHNRLMEAIISAPIHIIATMRAKAAYVVDEKGKPRKVGTEPVQRDGVDYEFTVVGDLDLSHALTISKSRVSRVLPVGETYSDAGEEQALAVARWLDEAGGPDLNPSDVELPATSPSPVDRLIPTEDAARKDPPRAREGGGKLDPDAKMTDAQRKKLFATVNDLVKLDPETDWNAGVKEYAQKLGRASRNDLTVAEATVLIDRLTKKLEEGVAAS